MITTNGYKYDWMSNSTVQDVLIMAKVLELCPTARDLDCNIFPLVLHKLTIKANTFIFTRNYYGYIQN